MEQESKLFTVLRLLKKYRYNILFPTLVSTFIYLDYAHTQRWKASKQNPKLNV